MPTASIIADAQRPVVTAERELKFELGAGRVPLARRMLETLCRRDPEFPSAFVWTVYYDTPDLESLGEKIDSDYVKAKMRVRWYSEPGRLASGAVFVEAKRRLGTLRDKARVKAPYDASELASWNLQDPRWRQLPLLLQPQGILLRGDWSPLLLLRYRRDRYLDPVSRARVSLDAEIAGVAANRRFVAMCDPRPLGLGVLEIKGMGQDLPVALRPLLQLGVRKQAVSKFMAVYKRMTHSIF